MPPEPFDEREYLKLAMGYLQCRWVVMGHLIESNPYPGDLRWALLGMTDYELEMRLIFNHVDTRSIYGASLCSGIGALDLAVSIVLPEYRCVLHCEREISAAEVLVTRMEEGSIPEGLIWDDLTTLPADRFRGVVSLLTAGLPCTPYSVAGKQLGDKDERYIWPAFFRIIREMRPAVVLLENVAAFAAWFRPIGEELSGLGYEFEAGLFSAEECGASHKRLRWFALCWLPGDPRSADIIGKLADGPRGGCGIADGSHTQLGHATGDDERRDTMPGAYREWFASGGPGGSVADTDGWQREREQGREGEPAPGTRPDPERCQPAVADAGNGLMGDPERAERWPLNASGGCGGEGIDREREASGGTGEPGEVLGNPDLARLEGRRIGEYGTDERTAGQAGNPELADAMRERRQQNAGSAPCDEETDGRAGWIEREPDSHHQFAGDGTGCRSSEYLAYTGRFPGPGNDQPLHGRKYEDGEVAQTGSAEVADAGCSHVRESVECEHEAVGRQQHADIVRGSVGSELPLFAPGPGATDLWQRILREFPELAPAISEEEAQRLLRAMADGDASSLACSRTNGLRALGNAVVAQCAALALVTLARRSRLILTP